MGAAHVPRQHFGGNKDAHKVMGAAHVPRQHFGGN